MWLRLLLLLWNAAWEFPSSFSPSITPSGLLGDSSGRSYGRGRGGRGPSHRDCACAVASSTRHRPLSILSSVPFFIFLLVVSSAHFSLLYRSVDAAPQKCSQYDGCIDGWPIPFSCHPGQAQRPGYPVIRVGEAGPATSNPCIIAQVLKSSSSCLVVKRFYLVS